MKETRWRHMQVESDRIFTRDVYSTEKVMLREMSVLPPRTGLYESWGDIAASLKLFVSGGPSRPLLVTLPSSLCATVQTTLLIRRERPAEPLSEAEFEGSVSAALWKQFCRQRTSVSQRLNVGEPELVIGKATLLSIKLDGHRVATPIGFRAHILEVNVVYSVVSREGFGVLERIPAISTGYYVESGWAGAFVTGMTQPSRSLFIHIGFSQTMLFTAERGEVAYLDGIAWGVQRLSEVLADTLCISLSAALSLWDALERGFLSPLMKRRLEQLMHEELHIMLKGVASALQARGVSQAYIEAVSQLPAAFFSERLVRQAGIEARMWPFTKIVRGINAHFDLPLQGGDEMQVASVFAHAFFFRALSEYEHLNHAMMRRVRWLSTPAQSHSQ